jgi:hypothetical protein
MTIPTPGFTSADVATEAGISPPWNSDNAAVLALLADGALPYNSADLAGRSSADYIPNAIDIGNMTSHTADGQGFASVTSNTVTFTGINPSINVTIDTTDAEVNVFASGGGASTYALFYVYVNSTFVGSFEWSRGTNGQTTGISKTMTVNVPNNGTMYMYGEISISAFNNATGGAFATFNVKNASSGNTVLDTLTFSTSATSYTEI